MLPKFIFSVISDKLVYFNADRILHMSKGKIIAEYDPNEIKLNELESAVYG